MKGKDNKDLYSFIQYLIISYKLEKSKIIIENPLMYLFMCKYTLSCYFQV